MTITALFLCFFIFPKLPMVVRDITYNGLSDDSRWGNKSDRIHTA
jgi:hypothetical protein